MYAVTKNANNVITGLFREDYDNVPIEAYSISDEDGELLRHCSDFSLFKLGQGNLIISNEPPTFVPNAISRFQALTALHQASFLDDIQTYMAAPTTDWFEKLAWDEAQEFQRNSPMTVSLGSLFGLTEAQIDNLFIFAATIIA